MVDLVPQELLNNVYFQGVVISLAAALVIGILRLGRRILGNLMSALSHGRASSVRQEDLIRYRKRLQSDSFKVRHPWLKDQQVLQDILVPISVEKSGGHGRLASLGQALQAVWERGFLERPVPLVILGDPGSGKSIALRLATGMIWELKRDDDDGGYIPVLATFSEFRSAGFDVMATIVSSLMKRGFHRRPGDYRMAELLAAQGLEQGYLFLLLDGLDELDAETRTKASQALIVVASEYPQLPIIFSCRTAAWKGPLKTQLVVELETRPFNASAVREFVENWSFDPPKSRADLLETIRTQPHIGDLSRNPLMLTIVCFLYSQPKYSLPKNRAEFYEVCTRALLEEWDQAQAPERANRFDRSQKEQCLARLALNHLTGSNPDDDISEPSALAEIGHCMEEELGLKRSKNAALLEEIIQNSGLLTRMPPLGVRFPHQTFLEYFAALRVLGTASCAKLIQLFDNDPGKWKEVILLYCGLNSDPATSDRVVNYMSRLNEPGRAVTIVAQARAVSPKVAKSALKKARESLLSGSDDIELISGLGYLSANELSTSGPVAQTILFEALRDDNGSDFSRTQQLLVACLRRPNNKTVDLVVRRLEQIDFRQLLPVLGEEALPLLTRLLRVRELAVEKKREFIQGLTEAGAVELLVDLAGRSKMDPPSDTLVVDGLLLTSSLPAFWSRLNEVAESLVSRRRLPEVADGDWPFHEPSSDHGRRVAVFLGQELSCRLGVETKIESKPVRAHPWIEFIALLSCPQTLSDQGVANIRTEFRPLAFLPNWLAQRFITLGSRLNKEYAKSEHPLVALMTAIVTLCGIGTPVSVMVLYADQGEHVLWNRSLALGLSLLWIIGHIAVFKVLHRVDEAFGGEKDGFISLVRPLLLPVFAAPFFSVLASEFVGRRKRLEFQMLFVVLAATIVTSAVLLGGLPWLLDGMLCLSFFQLLLIVPLYSSTALPPPFLSVAGQRVATVLEQEPPTFDGIQHETLEGSASAPIRILSNSGGGFPEMAPHPARDPVDPSSETR